MVLLDLVDLLGIRGRLLFLALESDLVKDSTESTLAHGREH